MFIATLITVADFYLPTIVESAIFTIVFSFMHIYVCLYVITPRNILKISCAASILCSALTYLTFPFPECYSTLVFTQHDIYKESGCKHDNSCCGQIR